MKPLHISEPRCHGRDTKVNTTICPHRNNCLRHAHLDVDRQLGINELKGIKVMNLPVVGTNACVFRLQIP